jgi:heme exporter protein A
MSLVIENLTLERGGWRLFEGLSLDAPAGSHVALTGPNGAGKTSLLRALAGFLRPTSGTIRFQDRAPEEAQPSMHVLGHRDGLKPNLDARAHVQFWGGLLGHEGDGDKALETVGLARVADLPARMLSAGQARRLALARLLIAPRPLWLLDEPAASLDSDGKALLEGLIATHRAGGGIVVAAVHEPLGAPTRTVRLA